MFFPLLFVVAQAEAQNKIEYNGEGEMKIGHRAISYIASSDSILGLRQAKSIFERGGFEVNAKPDLNLGIATDNYWVTFTITNTSFADQEVYLNLENPRLNDVEVYVLSHDSLIQTFRLGDNFPFQERAVQYAQFAFPVGLPEAGSLSIFLFIKHKGNTLQMPVRLLSKEAFLKQVEVNYLFAGSVSGIFLITFFFGLFFLINTKYILA